MANNNIGISPLYFFSILAWLSIQFHFNSINFKVSLTHIPSILIVITLVYLISIEFLLMSIFFDETQPRIGPGQVFLRSTKDPRELLYIEIQGEIKSTLPLSELPQDDDENKRYLWGQELGQYEELDVC